MIIGTYGSADEADCVFPDIMQTDKLMSLMTVYEGQCARQKALKIMGEGKTESS